MLAVVALDVVIVVVVGSSAVVGAPVGVAHFLLQGFLLLSCQTPISGRCLKSL